MKGQKIRVLQHLEKYGSITSMDAFKEYGITRLAARIKDLRELGYDIITIMIENKNRYNEDTRYAKYVLKGEHDGNESTRN